MSDEKKTESVPEYIPEFVKKAPELLPVWDWWVKEGKSTLLTLAVAAAVVGAFFGVRNYLQTRDLKANQEFANAYSIDDLEAAASNYGSSSMGPAIKLRLAKSYFDAERYQDALDVYDGLVAQAGKIPALADMAVIGRAYSLEGLAKYKEASDAYSAFAKDSSKTNSYLALTAKLGVCRCQALSGDKDGAVKALETLKTTVKDDRLAEMRVERLADAVKRYDPKRAKLSLFDAADAAEKSLEAEKASKATAKPAVKPAAPAAKPAAPAAKPAAK